MIGLRNLQNNVWFVKMILKQFLPFLLAERHKKMEQITVEVL